MGYYRVWLNGKHYYKHRLICEQFIPNPDNLPEIDHIDKDRGNYHLKNLRWVSRSENQKNKTSHFNITYQFITDIPDDAIKVDYYETRTERRYFADNQYFYSNIDGKDVFYMRITDEGLYKIMHINCDKNKYEFVYMQDTNNKNVQVFISKFRHLYDLN